MKTLSQITHYFSVYKKHVGNRLFIVFGLSALAAVTEGFGIAMLLPLIDAAEVGLGNEVSEPTGVKMALGNVLDRLGIGGSMVGILLFIAVVFLLKGLIVFSANAYQSHLKSQLMREIKTLMFDKFSMMDYSYYGKHNTGHFVNMMNVQVANLITSFENFKLFLATILATVAYIGTAFFMAWDFALMALGAGLGMLFLFRGLNNYVHGLSRKTVREHGVLNEFLVQSIQFFKYLASTAQLDHLRTGMLRSIGKLSRYMRSEGIAQALTTALSEPIAIFFVLLVIIFQVSVFNAPLAPIFVALVLFNRAMGSIIGIQQAWQKTLSKIGSLEIVENEFRRLENNREPNGSKRPGLLQKGIELQHVSFAYDRNAGDVLKDMTLTIPANSMIAIVGKSGSGKSTLADLLTLMLRPRSGNIKIDGICGNDMERTAWRKQIGYVSQETVIFDDTVANNICLWQDDFANDPAIRQRIALAARQAHAEGFIEALPDKYETLVGDRGVRLSGGQRQRLFLARELYKRPRLLILDEATSALDSESEKYIRQSIEALKGSMTVVIIAHRLSTIKHADYICLLDGGKILEQGTYRDLLGSDTGRFQRMVGMQSL